MNNHLNRRIFLTFFGHKHKRVVLSHFETTTGDVFTFPFTFSEEMLFRFLILVGQKVGIPEKIVFALRR